jgi:hypothetical protein
MQKIDKWLDIQKYMREVALITSIKSPQEFEVMGKVLPQKGSKKRRRLLKNKFVI